MRTCVLTVLLLQLTALSAPLRAGEPLRSIGAGADGGFSAAIVVDGPALVQTTQLVMADAALREPNAPDAAAQTRLVVGWLENALEPFGSGLDRIVRLHVYVASEADLPAVRRALADVFAERFKPAATFVVTALPEPNARVALDAIAAAGEAETLKQRSGAAIAETIALMPQNARLVFVSGQAERADGLAAATRATLHGLGRTLEHLKLKPADVVQVKAFLKPMSEADAARREIAAFFPDGMLPPVAFVEWKDAAPVEIELMATRLPATDREKQGERIQYVTPPGLSASPVFSRVAIVESGPLVFTSGLVSRRAGDGETQVRDIFGQLSVVLKEAGSDMRHLAKATYYVTDAETSGSLTAVRRELFDPARPPAASKASVLAVGTPGRSIAIDMIAVARRSGTEPPQR